MIDIGMLDCQVSMLENAFSRYFATGEIPRPMGTRHPTYTPFQAFETADGYIVMAMVGGTRNQWQTFCAVNNMLEFMDDERYQTGESRTEHTSNWRQFSAV
jgi:CoA:oxalate CoA-transferase